MATLPELVTKFYPRSQRFTYAARVQEQLVPPNPLRWGIRLITPSAASATFLIKIQLPNVVPFTFQEWNGVIDVNNRDYPGWPQAGWSIDSNSFGGDVIVFETLQVRS